MRGKYFTGLFLILLGFGFLMDQLGYFDFGDIISMYWPLILILLGVSGLFDRNSSKTGSFTLIALGLMFQVNNLNLVEINVFRLFLPVLLIIIGLNLMFSRGVRKHRTNVEPEKWVNENINMEDTLNIFVLFSGNTSKNQSLEFKGGKATAIFGGIELDLREAKLKDNKAFLDLTALFGGIEIRVPDTWRVEMDGTPIFGGVENATRPNSDLESPVLKVTGTAIFGGIDISN